VIIRNVFFTSLVLVVLIASGAQSSTEQDTAPQPLTNEQIRIANTLQVKRNQESMDRHDQLQARTEALLATQEKMLGRQSDDFARFEKILDTWERQQSQYQRYLDSLSTSAK
jgi:hypothetical protein